VKRFDRYQYLIHEIEQKREEMILAAFCKGFTSSETVKKSEELDKLLNLHQQFAINTNYAYGFNH
jgi:hypothetical protein